MPHLRDTVLRALPPQLRQAAVDFKNLLWGGYAARHYSQFAEDVLVGKLLGKKPGFYVDIGANHPKRYSNTYLLYKAGWRGINIDPNDDAIKDFKRTRPNDISIACAIGKERGTALLYRYADPAFNTLSEAAALALKEKKWLTPLPPKQVPVVPLSEVLTEHLPEGTPIGFMNIDVEGLDLAVLESNDWSRYAPHALAVEDHEFDAATPSTSRIYSFVSAKGYALKGLAGPTLIFQKI